MNLLRQLFGREDAKATQVSRMFTQVGPESSPDRRVAAAELAGTRRDMMRAALSKTLTRHGIPAAWLGSEMLMATSRGREPGMHWRLVVKHWDPRLLTHAVALQNSLVVRLLGYDPTAVDWLLGISWQFDLPDEADCPPLPQAGFWTADSRPAAPPSPAAPAVPVSAEVIAGPVRIVPPKPEPSPADAPDSVRSDLDRLLAVRDAELKRHAAGPGGTEVTEPMYLKTQPAPLGSVRRPA